MKTNSSLLRDVLALVLDTSARGRKRRPARLQALLIVLILALASTVSDCLVALATHATVCRNNTRAVATPSTAATAGGL
jgi:hypothetical protein